MARDMARGVWITAQTLLHICKPLHLIPIHIVGIDTPGLLGIAGRLVL